MSELEETLLFQLHALGLPTPEREVRLVASRRYRVDFVYRPPFVDVDPPLAIEVDGGTWNGGRHVRGDGYERDAEKLNEVALLGFTVMRFTGDMVTDGRAADYITRYLTLRTAQGQQGRRAARIQP